MNPGSLDRPLTDLEVSTLRDFFEGSSESMSLLEAEGFLTGIVSAPTTIMPSEWHPVMLGGHEFDSREEAQRVFGLLMRLYNQVNTDLNKGLAIYPTPTLADAELKLWCSGYLEVCRIDSVWREDDVAMAKLLPFGVLAGQFELEGEQDSEERVIGDATAHVQQYKRLLPQYVLEIHNYWVERRRNEMHVSATVESQKIGRNELCPCGSGSKYKKCCGRQ
jgi:uncharacterized protein